MHYFFFFLADTLDGLIKIFALYLKHCLGISDSQGRFVQSYSWSQISSAPEAGAMNTGGSPTCVPAQSGEMPPYQELIIESVHSGPP